MFLFFLFLSFAGITFAEGKRIATPFVLFKVEAAPELNVNTALFVFEFQELLEEDRNAEITLSLNGGENETIQLKKGSFEYPIAPGSHQFVIYINENYFELYSYNLVINDQQKHIYHVTPWHTDGMILEVDKPVIYLYPETTESFEVEVSPVGEMVFTYPEYKQNWQGTMHPDGALDIDGETYRYLFWESKQKVDALNPVSTEGFVVPQSDVVSFLEDKLIAVGFTATERADFITFWGPQMQKHSHVFVTFHQDAECDKFAELNIGPKPDNLHRFYISWGEYNGSTVPVEQELTPFKRAGFTVIEWGGQEIPTIYNTLSL